MNCKICLSSLDYFHSALVLKKYQVNYYRCTYCGFIQTDEPYWLEEAYSEAVNDYDIGLVSRNISNVLIANFVIRNSFNKNGIYLDYGGGYGLFVRLMRDRGINMYRYDFYCENLFAKGYDLENTEIQSFDMVSAFELFEHFIEPHDDIAEIRKYSDSILFSTLLIPSNQPKIKDWWYYLPEHGQHVSFYTKKALNILAEKSNLKLLTNETNMHMLTDKNINIIEFRVLTNQRLAKIYDFFCKNNSLLWNDFNKIIK